MKLSQEITLKQKLKMREISICTGISFETVRKAMKGLPISQRTYDKINGYFKSKAMEYIKGTT